MYPFPGECTKKRGCISCNIFLHAQMGELSFSSSSSLVSWALKLIPSQKMDIIMNSSGKKHNLFLFQLSSLVLQITKDDNHNLEP